METIFIIALVGGFAGLAMVSAIGKKWWNVAWWVFCGIGFGLFELLGKMFFGATISRAHAQIGVDHPALGILLAVLITVFFAAIWWHLFWDFGLKRLFKGKKE